MLACAATVALNPAARSLALDNVVTNNVVAGVSTVGHHAYQTVFPAYDGIPKYLRGAIQEQERQEQMRSDAERSKEIHERLAVAKDHYLRLSEADQKKSIN